LHPFDIYVFNLYLILGYDATASSIATVSAIEVSKEANKAGVMFFCDQ